MLEKLIKDWLVGSNIVIKSTSIFSGNIPLMAIRYKYTSQWDLGFISVEGGGSTKQGVP